MSFQYLKHARKIICIGRNYAAHVKELNNTVPKHPFFFLKPTSSIITPEPPRSNDSPRSVVTPGENRSPIYVPRGVQVHHEIELALVMKSTLSNVDPTTFMMEDLLPHVKGVALALDLTGRNVQSDAKKAGLPWTIAKGYDTFCPISGMVPLEQLTPRPTPETFQDAFRVSCAVNGTLRQDDSTSLMLNGMDKLVATIAQTMRLEENDIVLTGTPQGVGEIVPGDVISGSLHYNGAEIVHMSFDVQQKPGTYTYKASV
ncbi:Fmp41p KNAG_0F01360 [Huiozyma naganishii CBS 8797]|uniref:Fumarylacetoacetase-like C-terminal domain-containing protein n=1 Tax=Huiozyma naganishii (strain ATCC MYA-139 / BCRC 22969 / CBS 8797 / KCTC 17520 / NBRC 10181 / NCYC 3082 / Yp74L-3) TaxID=1071383 RepID=J7S768_HUIN7|nr:hypothetical protein KNAG_0F01360 [Kazachstania naganishii CBS 8797]CCK70804.1 hypothetical protein KNAG_0F01360 [Kazachstania naganishii CBS 8797]